MALTPAKTRILAIDIGGSGLKAAIVGPEGKLLTERQRIPTPKHPRPSKVCRRLLALVEPLGGFDAVSVGFPGVVIGGRVRTAPNLGTKDWQGFDLGGFLAEALGKDVRVLNDADVQGLGAVAGKGFEVVATLGTGFGTSWFDDGRLLPHVELAHLPVNGKADFDDYLGARALKAIGRKKWNRRVAWVVQLFSDVMNFDHLYLGGGNAEKIAFDLPPNVSRIPNEDGLRGAAFVWRMT